MCLQMGPNNVSCKESLLRSDRLVLVYLLYSNLEDIWSKSDCDSKSSPGILRVSELDIFELLGFYLCEFVLWFELLSHI